MSAYVFFWLFCVFFGRGGGEGGVVFFFDEVSGFFGRFILFLGEGGSQGFPRFPQGLRGVSSAGSLWVSSGGFSGGFSVSFSGGSGGEGRFSWVSRGFPPGFLRFPVLKVPDSGCKVRFRFRYGSFVCLF